MRELRTASASVPESPHQPIERNIWILWLQGFENAPELVQLCSRSWVAKNPAWRVHFLTGETVSNYLSEDFQRDLSALHLPPQKTANLIRLHLISRHGGVWADADCYCALALDEWLPSHLAGGFFAFRFGADAWLEENRDRPLSRVVGRSKDRVLANWFLAGRAGNPVSSMFLRHHLGLFKVGRFGERPRRRMVLRPALLFLRRNAYLASFLASKRLFSLARAFPYFIFHYDFAKLLLIDTEFRRAWGTVSHLDGEAAIRYSKSLHLAADERFLKDMSGRGAAPVFKFHWRQENHANTHDSRYQALLDMEGHSSRSPEQCVGTHPEATSK